MNKERIYVCIDLKSFYASCECVKRNLDPLQNNLVVADSSRTDKTICLAVSPSLKSYGIGGRCRLFELVQKINEINVERKKKINNLPFKSSSFNNLEVLNDPFIKLDYIVAKPRMALYIDISTKIYGTYLEFVSKEDIHVYSIDEVFIDITSYLKANKMDEYQFVRKIIQEVFRKTKITATAGIGTNLFLAKVACDIVAKHVNPDSYGCRIGYLNEEQFKKTLWAHTPITDFWRVGIGTMKRLKKYNLNTMGDIARFSITNEDILFKEFGVNAELLIDHAWGVETATIKDIKNYKPQTNSISEGQVLHFPYVYKDALLILKEMVDSMALNLVNKGLYATSIGLMVGYDKENVYSKYCDEVIIDYLGRQVPKPSSVQKKLTIPTRSASELSTIYCSLFENIVNRNLTIRRINLSCSVTKLYQESHIQYDIFTDFNNIETKEKEEEIKRQKEEKVQKTILEIKEKFGKNSILKGMNLEEKATMKERNTQIGGHNEK